MELIRIQHCLSSDYLKDQIHPKARMPAQHSTDRGMIVVMENTSLTPLYEYVPLNLPPNVWHHSSSCTALSPYQLRYLTAKFHLSESSSLCTVHACEEAFS